jgi:WD40 repeat protein
MAIHIGRREFVTLLGAAATWPLVARFAQRLRELGWIEGRTVAIEFRWGRGTQRARGRGRSRVRSAQGRYHCDGGNAADGGGKAGNLLYPDLFIGERSEVVRLEGHSGSVHALAVLADGRLASGATYDGTIRLWNLVNTKKTCSIEVDGTVLCLAALPDGRLVAGDELGQLHWLQIVN